MNSTKTKKPASVFAQMSHAVEGAKHLLVANSSDFWESDRRKMAEANPGAYLWIVHQSGTDFYRLGSFPSQQTLLSIISNRMQEYGIPYVEFYRVEIQSLNNHISKLWDRPQGSVKRLTLEGAIALIDSSFRQQISA